MNGARSTFRRKGYLLTALAAAVLLAASPGIASAQSVGFEGSTSRTMMEGASPDKDTAAPIEVEFRISGLVVEGDNADPDALGTLTLQHNADVDPPGAGEARTSAKRRIWIDSESAALDASALDSGDAAAAPNDHLYGVDSGDTIPYDNNGVVKLVIIDPDGDGDWVDTKFTMTLRADAVGVTPSPATVTVTITDGNAQPTVSFSKTSVSLTEDSQTFTPIAVNLAVPKGMEKMAPGGMGELMNEIQFMTSPAGAVVLDEARGEPGDAPAGCVKGAVIAVELAHISAVENAKDTWQVNGPAGEIAGNATIDIRACMDDAGFRDEMVTFSFVEKSLAGMPMGLGNVAAGNELVVTVQSEGEDAPVVSFATTSIDIDEGMTNTVAILADGKLGTEVGSVMVSVSGDAMLSLWQDDEMLEAGADGMYEVDLMGSANTILTISADSDRALEDGMTSMGTITIESASGADIGDRNTLMVTVSGATAVPALPLVGQLLLALFLLAGGSRLYRRRRNG